MSFRIQNARELIPQREPFAMVDHLLYADEQTSRSRFEIRPDNIFLTSGRYSSSGMVESMAQTAAAGTGYWFRQSGKEVPVGYIGAVQKLEVYDWPGVNTEIDMEITLITKVLQVSLVSGTVTCNDKIIARCEMKIFVNDPQQNHGK